MIKKPLDLVGVADVAELVAIPRREDRTIDYKQELPAGANQHRNDFLYDVSAFANAGGGDIVYGVTEARDANNKTTGLPQAAPGLIGTNADQEVRRLQNMIRTGIDPAIPGLQVRSIGDGPAGPIIIVRVPQSWAAPHMVSVDGLSKFYVRNGPEKHPLDREGIRRAFFGAESLRTSLERFRDRRLGMIVADEAPVKLAPGSRMVLHVVPLASLDGSYQDNLAEVFRPRSGGVRPERSLNAGTDRRNFDGVLVSIMGSRGVTKYIQVFSNGAIELVAADQVDSGNVKVIGAVITQHRALETLVDTLSLYRRAAVPEPAYVILSLLGVRGRVLHLGQHHFLGGNETAIDRDNLIFPEVRIDDWSAEPAKVLRPLFDGLWQSAGYDGCHWYGADGSYRPH